TFFRKGFCQCKAICFSILRHVINKTATKVIALYGGFGIYFFCFGGLYSSAKYFVPCSMDSSVPNELGDRPNDSLLCITSSAVPPLSTAIIATNIGTCSPISYSLA